MQPVTELTRALTRSIGSGMAASFVILTLVVLTWGPDDPRVRPGLDLAVTPEHLGVLYVRWLLTPFSPGPAETWSGLPYVELLPPLAQAASLVTAVLLLSGALAIRQVRRELWEERLHQRDAGSWLAMLSLAPPLLWAAFIGTAFNLLVALLVLVPGGAWLAPPPFPDTHTVLTWTAAVLVLTLGGGTLSDLRSGLRADLARLMREDFVLVAMSAGLDAGPILVRNLIVPFAIRLVGKVPLLLGEAVVVDLCFFRSGIGRTLLTHAEQRDGAALMFITAAFVVWVVLLRQALHALERRLIPPVVEEVV